MRTTLAISALAGALLAQAPVSPPPAISLAQAIQLARANSPQFQAALVAQGVAGADQTAARAGLLPSLNFNTSAIYTQAGRYIANNGVHEYSSQANLHEALGFASLPTLQRAQAGVALARAQAEVAARGLVAAVVGGYYTLAADRHKLATAQLALANAQKYLRVSQDRERGGEVAHADVIKAQIELQQKQRDLRDAQLVEQQSRLTLAVLLFPTFDTNFTLVDDLDQPPPLPPQAQVTLLAERHNPDLAAAEAALRQAGADVGIARAALLPGLTLDYFYGIDAAQFATRNQLGQPNLGSAATATVAIPIFDWGANRGRLHVAGLQRQQAQRQLSLTQRQLLANLEGFYAEATTAREELASLASSRDLAAESLRLTALRYQNGDATILELVDAQNTDSLARNAYADGQVRYRLALAQLQTLTGTF